MYERSMILFWCNRFRLSCMLIEDIGFCWSKNVYACFGKSTAEWVLDTRALQLSGVIIASIRECNGRVNSRAMGVASFCPNWFSAFEKATGVWLWARTWHPSAQHVLAREKNAKEVMWRSYMVSSLYICALYSMNHMYALMLHEWKIW